jgi:hypothetical protein
MAEERVPGFSWANGIGSRDGTLNFDSYTKNCLFEKTGQGLALFKRPGNILYSTLPGVGPGPAQGLTNAGNGAGNSGLAITNDTIVPLGSGTTVVIPGVATYAKGYPYEGIAVNQAGITYLKSQFGLWTYNSSVVTQVAGGYINSTVPGIVFLDGVFYVMGGDGTIYGSGINDGTTWPGLDFTAPPLNVGRGAGIARHLTYVAAFYSNGLQLYYDANAAPNGQGIALSPVLNASYTTGCVNGRTIASISDNTFFVSHDGRQDFSVKMLQGTQLVDVATPGVCRLLNSNRISLTPYAVAPVGGVLFSNNVWSFCVRLFGHQCYILVVKPLAGSGEAGLTLVYDIDMQSWHVWSSVVGGVEQYFSYAYPVELLTPTGGGINPPATYVQDLSTGNVCQISNTAYTDTVGNIPVVAVTPNIDWNTLRYKRFARMLQHADTINTSIGVSFSDNDYQSFSTPRSINLASTHKMLTNCGSSRRRAWRLTHTDNTPLRVYDMELMMEILNR